MKKEKIKKILNFVLIFGTLAIVLLVGFRGEDFADALKALQSLSPVWVALCLAAYAVNVMCDACATWYFLRRQGYDIGPLYALHVTIVGTYYSCITPGATGGQPMQLLNLNRAGVPMGLGTSALTVKFMCFQAMLTVLSTVLWATHFRYVQEQISGNMWILIIGYVYNLVVVGLTLSMGTSRRLVKLLLNLIIGIGTKLRLVKDPDGTRERWHAAGEVFHTSFTLLLKRPGDLLVQLFIGGMQLMAQMTIIYLLFHAFGLSGHSYFQITTLGILQYVSAAYTPLPGASGAQEGVFALYFSQVFPDGVRVVALLLWRFFTYYIWLIIGAVVTVWRGIHPLNRKARILSERLTPDAVGTETQTD